MNHRNFARGEAPPSHSYEWAGVAKPPETTSGKAAAPAKKPAAPAGRQGIPVMVATLHETIVIEKKPKKHFLPFIAAGGAGFALGWFYRGR